MIAAILSLAVAATPAAPLKLALPGLSGPNLEAKEAEFYSEHLAQQLSGRGLQVTTPKQISALLGLERQRAITGCSEEGESCMAELANALGVDGIVMGEIGKLEGKYQVNLKVLSPNDGRPMTLYTARVNNTEELLDTLNRGAKHLAVDLCKHFQRPLPLPSAEVAASEEAAAHPLKGKAWVPLAAGAVLGGAGAFLWIQADQQYRTLTSTSGSISASDARKARDQGAMMQSLAVAGMGLGAAGLATAVAFWVIHRGDTEEPSTSVFVVPTQGGAGVGGRMSW